MKKDQEDKLIKKALGRALKPKEREDITTMIGDNGDFVVQDRGKVIGRLKKGTFEKKNFKEFKTHVDSILIAEQKTAKKWKAGKKKQYNVELKQDGAKIVAYIDGDKLDSFKDEKEAEKAVNDFIKLLGE